MSNLTNLHKLKTMNKRTISILGLCAVLCMVFTIGNAQNPIIRDQYTADPSGRVINGKVYVFPSHDILAVEGKGRPGWFCMEDYHVFSSENLTDWTDHGMIVSQTKVAWVDSNSYSMWAPDCIEKDGKYYFYFPSNKKPDEPGQRGGFTIGVAVAEQPEGPYVPQDTPIEGVRGIDPNVFIDNDGQAYLYWSMGNIYVAKLKDNMLELASEPQVIANLPEKGLKEGPYVIERKGIYYLTFPHVENKIERLEYAIGDHPMGPFKMTGVIMDESPMNCWTNHHSFIQYNDQWYLFYHQNAYSPHFDKNRSICMDSLFFNDDGTIQKVLPTHRGVGITKAADKIQIDRYSAISDGGAGIELLDTMDTFKGWKAILETSGAWMRYNAVDFGSKKMKRVEMKCRADAESVVEVHLGSADGPLLASIKVPANETMVEVKQKIKGFEPGLQDICVVAGTDGNIEIDWIQFN